MLKQSLWLLWVLANRELKRKYKSTTLGFLWILINPLLQMAVLTVVFSYFFKMSVKDYPLFVLSGLLPWTFFSISLQAATRSLVENRDLIKKIPFPRELLPISSVLAHLFTSSLAIAPLALYVTFHSGFRPQLLLLAPILLLETALVIGLGLLLSSLEIYYRDVSFIIQAALMVWFYLTPIFYPLEMVPRAYISLYRLNSMVGIITAFRSVFLGTSLVSSTALMIGMAETLILLGLGILVFRKRSKYFADWV